MLFTLVASSTLAALCLAPQAAQAAPLELVKRAPADAPYTQANSVYEQAITCPNGIAPKSGGIVLLVHGTAAKGDETWANGPYNLFLPTAGPGYDICWVDLPNRSLGDAQLSAEYVAYGISYLAGQSATGKVNIIGHSQGAGFNPQWALTFWPSKRQYVSNYVALAGDFRGSAEGTLVCPAVGGCQPSVWQQSITSRYVSAQNSKQDADAGGKALVPTHSIFTRYDDIIQPETPNAIATSFLSGATNHALQDLDVCGPLQLADHVAMLVNPAAYGLALATLQYGPAAALSKFDKVYCTMFKDNVLADFSNTAAFLRSVLANGIAATVGQRVPNEPLLQPYVCQRGYAAAADCKPVSGFTNNYSR